MNFELSFLSFMCLKTSAGNDIMNPLKSIGKEFNLSALIPISGYFFSISEQQARPKA